MRITSTTSAPVSRKERIAAGPADWITDAAADEQAGADHPAEGDHLHVPLLKTVLKPAARRMVILRLHETSPFLGSFARRVAFLGSPEAPAALMHLGATRMDQVAGS